MRPDVRFLLLGLASAALLSSSCSDDGSVATEGASSRGDVSADTEWDDAVLEADGVSLSLMVGSSPPGDGPCSQNFEHEVTEEHDRVVIAVDELPPAPTTSTTALVGCAAMLQPQRIDVTLDAPLGDREVFDGLRPEPRTVWDKGELVEVTWLPEGFRAEEPFSGVGDARQGWQQTFMAEGADWYVNVVQGPAGSLRCVEDEVDSVTVHGIRATVCDGMGGTMRTIQWVEDGLDLQVWGEMQGPPTFTHDEELLAVAEGVELPG